jgi:lipoate-protein ligase A
VVMALNTWRLLKLENHDGFMNMAIDESILQARMRNLVPNTIRLYRWNPSAVSIGRFQDIQKEVQLENCRANGVDVVRRITGGGTVYHDAANEITYSVIARKCDLGTEDINEVYNRIYSGFVRAVQTLGVRADFNRGNEKICPNLTIRGRKISGSAQAHKKGFVLQHGTLLLRVDLEKMFTLLRVPWAKTTLQVVNVAQKKITSLREELGKETEIEEVNEALIKGFEQALHIQFKAGELSPFEHDLSGRLQREKYSRNEWNNFGKSQL